MLEIKKIEKIEKKESVEVLAQKDCSTKRNPIGVFSGCKHDCTDPNKNAWFACDMY